MDDYALLKMRIRHENLLATQSSKIDKGRAVAGYLQALEISNRVIEEQLLRQDSAKLSPAMQNYYHTQVTELCKLVEKEAETAHSGGPANRRPHDALQAAEMAQGR